MKAAMTSHALSMFALTVSMQMRTARPKEIYYIRFTAKGSLFCEKQAATALERGTRGQMLKAQQAQLETSAAPGSLSRTIELFVTGRICLFGEHSDWAGGLCFQQVHRASSKRD